MAYGAVGQEPNNSKLQGIIKNAPVPGITTSTWNPRSGGSSKTTFKGTQDQITDLARTFKQNGYEYAVTGGHIWTLEVTYPWDIIVDNTEVESNPFYIWELVNLPFEKDIYDCNDRAFIAALPYTTKNRIDRNLKSNDPTAAAWDETVTDSSIMVNAWVTQALKRAGVRGRQSLVQSLKRTVVVPLNYNVSSIIRPDFDLKVMTKSELLTYYNDAQPLNNVPLSIQSAMPSTLPLTPLDSPTQPVSGYSMDKNGINTFVGYLQYPPEFNMISNLKVQVTQHWVFNAWSAGAWGLYDPANSANGIGQNPSIIFI
jgi:hypothetical protein